MELAPDDPRPAREARRHGVLFVLGLTAGLPALVWAVFAAGGGLARITCGPHTHAEMDVLVLTQLVQRHAIENGGLPPESLEALLVPDASGRALLERETLPRDPWGRVYVYERTATRPGFRVLSLGADGLPGGRGDDRDVLVPGSSEAEPGRAGFTTVEGRTREASGTVRLDSP